MLISIILSFRNEEKTILELVNRIHDSVSKIDGIRYELIFVNDRSSDNSLEILVGLQDRFPIKILNMSRTYGVTPCVLAGLQNCSGEVAIYMDSDLQDPPELIPQMYSKFQNGADVVHCKRVNRLGESKLKMFITKIAYKLINYISDINLPENTGDFKLLSRRAITHILEFREADPYMRGLSIWIGFNQETIPYTRLSRFAGKTHFSIFSKGPFLEFIRGITSFSVAPLYFCFLLGCTALVGIIIFSLITLILKFLNLLVPGSAGILLLISGLGSIIIFMLGIIALYISRIYIETKKRPRYIIDNIINKKKGDTN